MDRLTQQQKAFADYVLETGNQTEAYLKAYPNVKKNDTAAAAASRLLRNVNVSAYIEKRRQQIEDDRIADVKEVMQYLTAVMRGEVKDQFELDAPIAERTRAAQEILKRDSEKRRYNLELLKLESQLNDNQLEDEADDNFMDALNASAQEVWNEPVE